MTDKEGKPSISVQNIKVKFKKNISWMMHTCNVLIFKEVQSTEARNKRKSFAISHCNYTVSVILRDYKRSSTRRT